MKWYSKKVAQPAKSVTKSMLKGILRFLHKPIFLSVHFMYFFLINRGPGTCTRWWYLSCKPWTNTISPLFRLEMYGVLHVLCFPFLSVAWQRHAFDSRLNWTCDKTSVWKRSHEKWELTFAYTVQACVCVFFRLLQVCFATCIRMTFEGITLKKSTKNKKIQHKFFAFVPEKKVLV